MGNLESNPQHTHDRWWLSGEQTCGFCAQFYCVEVEYRCVDCDRPVCPICAITVRESRQVFCPECARAGE